MQACANVHFPIKAHLFCIWSQPCGYMDIRSKRSPQGCDRASVYGITSNGLSPLMAPRSSFWLLSLNRAPHFRCLMPLHEATQVGEATHKLGNRLRRLHWWRSFKQAHAFIPTRWRRKHKTLRKSKLPQKPAAFVFELFWLLPSLAWHEKIAQQLTCQRHRPKK